MFVELSENIKNLLFNDGELKIFNRWGNLIYENKSYANNWAPKNISDGVYFYIFYYPSLSKQYQGFLHVFDAD